jgi:hypothetical protein
MVDLTGFYDELSEELAASILRDEGTVLK